MGAPRLADAQVGNSGQDPAALLLKVDRLRNPLPQLSMQMDLRAGRMSQSWSVAVRANGDARVEGLSEKEKGRAVLVLGDDMWLLLPTAKRPIKVSPQQRMMGPASGGDLARTRFAADYVPGALSEDTLDGVPCLRLDLTARRSAISFRSARLWVSRNGERPIRAEFMLPSGKLAKIVRFGAIGSAMGKPVLESMTIEEPRGGSAELSFSHWAPLKEDPTRFSLPVLP
ncbi:MAG TPA: outer membrane lipoprotein-sorting protein [Holophagaceae bacterium]|nr:outer membrane lipoprotein-sorting protein [Holophagaceae bacterium]